jgi:hypothetical protein
MLYVLLLETVDWSALLIRIQEILRSFLGLDTRYSQFL